MPFLGSTKFIGGDKFGIMQKPVPRQFRRTMVEDLKVEGANSLEKRI